MTEKTVTKLHYDLAWAIVTELSNNNSPNDAFYVIASAMGMMVAHDSRDANDLKRNIAFGKRVISDASKVMFQSYVHQKTTIQ
jgi:hypothetical protein